MRIASGWLPALPQRSAAPCKLSPCFPPNPQVSGVSFAFDPARPTGSRVAPDSVFVSGQPLALDRRYKGALSRGGGAAAAAGRCCIQADDPSTSNPSAPTPALSPEVSTPFPAAASRDEAIRVRREGRLRGALGEPQRVESKI